MNTKCVLLLSLLCLPHYSVYAACKDKTDIVTAQKNRDMMNLKLAALAAIVTIATVKISGKVDFALTYDKLIMYLWNK